MLGHGCSLYQIHVYNAFLHRTLHEVLYMTQPPRFVDEFNPTYVCWLHKALYGLQQALKTWHNELK